MSSAKSDDMVAALVAHRILEAAVVDGQEVDDGLTDDDERRLDAVVGLYGASGPPERRHAPVAVVRAKRWRTTGWVSMVLAAAAAVVLSLHGRPDDAVPLGTRYEVILLRGLEEFRGSGPNDQPEVRVYREDRALEIWLRPVIAVDGPVEVVVYARREGEIQRLSVSPEVQNNGAVHIEARTSDVGLGVGEWELVFVVGRAGQMPASLDDVVIPAPADGSYDAQRVEVRVAAVDEPRRRGEP